MPMISKRQGLSLTYLEIIFAVLKAAGMIQSHRGPGGGYSLALKPEDISLKDVVNAIEGEQTPREDLCADLWVKLQVFMQEEMARISLSHVLSQSDIQIEPSTRGLSCFRPQAKAQASAPALLKAAKKTANKKSKQSLGPNSIFSFGKYLQLRKV